MNRRYVTTVYLLAGMLSGAMACTPFETARHPDAATSDASGGGAGGSTDGGGAGAGGAGGSAGGAGGSAASTVLRTGFETLAPGPAPSGAIQMVRQRLTAGSSVTCNGGICFSGGIEP